MKSQYEYYIFTIEEPDSEIIRTPLPKINKPSFITRLDELREIREKYGEEEHSKQVDLYLEWKDKRRQFNNY